jgi:hypothetical protein
VFLALTSVPSRKLFPNYLDTFEVEFEIRRNSVMFHETDIAQDALGHGQVSSSHAEVSY